jgi:hypothetical protein
VTISSSTVTFEQSGSGAVTRSVESKLRETISVKDFGATGDGTTDDYPAFANAIASLGDSGGQLFVPEGRYRLSQQLVLTRGVHLLGERQGSNPGGVGGVQYTYPSYILGSVLYFDAGVPGIILYEHTDEPDTTTVRNSIDQLGAGSPFFEYPSARNSIIANLAILSAGGGTSATHGIEARCVVRLEHLRVQGFGGHGVFISASADVSQPGSSFGNASLSMLVNVFCYGNGNDGFRIAGRDANVVQLDCCNAQDNGAWGFNDEGMLGNSYFNCHAATNTAGSFRATSLVGAHTYIGCYIEGIGANAQTSLEQACTVIGGNMGSAETHPAASQAFVMVAGLAQRAAYRHVNRRVTPAVGAHLGSSDVGPSVLQFGRSATFDEWKISANPITGNSWGLQYANSPSAVPIQWPDGIGRTGRNYAAEFPYGLCLGDGLGGIFGQVLRTAAALPTSGSYVQGDFLLNRAPALSQGKVLLGWIRLTTGSGHVLNTDWAECHVTNS